MTDTLEIFGTEYTGVAGIKATDDNDQIKTYIRPQGTKSISANGTGIDVTSYASVDVSVPSGQPNLQSKTYNVSSAGTTTVTADNGYDGLSNVAVSVPSASPFMGSSSETFVTEDGRRHWKANVFTEVNVSEGDTEGWLPDGYHQDFSFVKMAVPSNTTITPTESSQTIGGYKYMMEGAVTVGAISSTYVGSGITRRSSTDLTASGATVTVPSGYYSAQSSKAVASGSATAPTAISGTSATVSTGTNTLTLSKTVSNTPQVTAGYIASGTAGNSSVSLTANVTTKGATTYNASATDQTIASGTYLTGAQTIRGVTTSNLTAYNIKNGVTVTVGDSADADRVLSVTGTYSGGTSKNSQAVQGTTRTTSSTLTAIGAEMTVSKTGTYDVYWSAFRSNTSTQYTFATKLYINGTGYGSEQTTWSNHQQNVHLSNVSLTVNDKIRVYGRESRGSSYYMYAGTLTIIEA